MPVMDLARSDVIDVPPDASVTSVVEIMEDQSVGSVVVVEEETPIGLLTDRDLALQVIGRIGGSDGLTAVDVMTGDPFTVEQDAGIYETLSRATEAGVRRIPVVDDDGSLVGIVTLDDFVVLLASELENVSDIVQTESPPY